MFLTQDPGRFSRSPRRHPHACRSVSRRIVILTLIAPALFLVGACGDRTTTDPGPPDPQVPAVSPTPAQGPPGTIVVVESPALTDADTTRLIATVDGLPAPIRLSPSGPARIAIPFLAAGTGGDAPPDEAVTVELFEGDELVARSEHAFEVTALPPAPGAADSVADALVSVVESLSKAPADLGPEGSAPRGYAQAILGGLEALLVGDPDESLAAQLDRLAVEDPETRALLDGVLASSGVVDATRRLAEALTLLAARIDADGGGAALRSSSASMDPAWMTTTISDTDLAAKMQFYTVARLFGETVVAETAEEYANTVGLVSGAIGMGVSVPAASLVGAILGVANFAVNKVLLGVFPAELTRFDIVLEDDLLRPGDTTTARFDIEARNAPPDVGLQDFIALTLDLLGIADGVVSGGFSLEVRETFRDILENTASFYLTTIRSGLAAYAGEHPELDLDVSFSVIPDMTWTAVVHDPRLVDVLTHTPDVLAPLEDELNWHASGPDMGEGRVYARTATGEDAVVIDLPPGFSYAGGAFGEGVLATETRSVFVTSELILEVDFPTTLEHDEIGTVEVRAGHLDAAGETVWEPGIDISLTIDGGTLSRSGGTTGAGGEFTADAQLLTDSEGLIISVTAEDDLDQEVVRSVEATAVGAANVEVHRFEARVSVTPLTRQLADSVYEKGSDINGGSLAAAFDTTAQAEVSGETYHVAAGGTASTTWSTSFAADASPAELVVSSAVSAHAEGGSVSNGDPTQAVAIAYAVTYVELRFEVRDAAVTVAIDALGSVDIGQLHITRGTAWGDWRRGEYTDRSVAVVGQGQLERGVPIDLSTDVTFDPGEHRLYMLFFANSTSSGPPEFDANDVAGSLTVAVTFTPPGS